MRAAVVGALAMAMLAPNATAVAHADVTVQTLAGPWATYAECHEVRTKYAGSHDVGPCFSMNTYYWFEWY